MSFVDGNRVLISSKPSWLLYFEIWNFQNKYILFLDLYSQRNIWGRDITNPTMHYYEEINQIYINWPYILALFDVTPKIGCIEWSQTNLWCSWSMQAGHFTASRNCEVPKVSSEMTMSDDSAFWRSEIL